MSSIYFIFFQKYFRIFEIGNKVGFSQIFMENSKLMPHCKKGNPEAAIGRL